MNSFRKGFTLVELMVVVAVMAFTIIGGIAAYRKFNTRQLIVTSGKEMLVNFRQAQSKALTNVKTVPGCNNSLLVGYKVDGYVNSGASYYTITEQYNPATCATGGASYIIKTVNMPSGVTFQAPFSLTFTGLSGLVTLPGASPLSIAFCNKNCQTGGLKYTITITTEGLIQDLSTTDL